MAQQSCLQRYRIETNQKSIIGNSNDSFSRRGLKNKTVSRIRKGSVGARDLEMSKESLSKLISKFVFIALLISIPFVASASIRSFVTGMFKSASAEPEYVQNSQNMALLQAAVSSINQPLDGGDIAIVNDNSLLSENSGVALLVKEHSSDQIVTYVVRPGDTLSEIAKMFGVTTNTILWSNDIVGNKVSPGDRLVILPISGVRHVVKSGDTIQSIAKKYKGDPEEIAQFNDISFNSKLATGDTIIIPDGEVVSAVVSVSKTASSVKSIQQYVSAPKIDGYYARPLIGGVKSQGIHGHNGVDIASAFGTNILASASGEVIVAKNGGYNGGYGSYIVIKHNNGTQTLYAHLSAVQVSVGQDVYQGQIIGNMGSTGKSTGTHLHFEVRGARNPF
ncbi:MAG: peptidoglycan DD-metalloendopeptidase family protein [Minisyncoccota bacterium]